MATSTIKSEFASPALFISSLPEAKSNALKIVQKKDKNGDHYSTDEETQPFSQRWFTLSYRPYEHWFGLNEYEHKSDDWREFTTIDLNFNHSLQAGLQLWRFISGHFYFALVSGEVHYVSEESRYPPDLEITANTIKDTTVFGGGLTFNILDKEANDPLFVDTFLSFQMGLRYSRTTFNKAITPTHANVEIIEGKSVDLIEDAKNYIDSASYNYELFEVSARLSLDLVRFTNFGFWIVNEVNNTHWRYIPDLPILTAYVEPTYQKLDTRLRFQFSDEGQRLIDSMNVDDKSGLKNGRFTFSGHGGGFAFGFKTDLIGLAMLLIDGYGAKMPRQTSLEFFFERGRFAVEDIVADRTALGFNFAYRFQNFLQPPDPDVKIF